MRESFGARMRLHREKQGIALKAIADSTKINPALLEGLERDDISHWPSGIFRKAYVRAYAHAIGLNPDVIVREFFEIHPPPREIPEIEQAPPRRRSFLGSALGSFARRRTGRTADAAPDRQPFALNVPLASDPSRDVLTPDPPAGEPAPDVAFTAAQAVLDEAVAADDPSEVKPVPEPARELTAAAGQPDAADPRIDIDIVSAAEICTELGRVEDTSQVLPLLREAARLLEATGLIVWLYDPIAAELRPALVHGYSDDVLAQVPGVRRDDDNATAAAFRSGRTCTIRGARGANGALAVPMLAPGGCAGVLALELPDGREQIASVRAVATFVAAMLAQLAGGTAGPAVADEPVAMQQNG
jgi:transcriptional regulator with XRE-family HTH domain